MSNGNLATWIAHMEHAERAHGIARDERLLDDILPDNYAVRRAFGSPNGASRLDGGAPPALGNWLAALGDRIGRKRELVLDPSLNEECLGCSD